MRIAGRTPRPSLNGLWLLVAGGLMLLAASGLASAQLVPLPTPSLTPTIPVLPSPQPQVPPPTSPRPAVQPPETKFECPKTRSIDCMPVIERAKRPLCSKEYLDWARAHCPNVQVVY